MSVVKQVELAEGALIDPADYSCLPPKEWRIRLDVPRKILQVGAVCHRVSGFLHWVAIDLGAFQELACIEDLEGLCIDIVDGGAV